MSNWELLNKHRVRRGPFRSDVSHGFNGAFFLYGPNGEHLRIIALDGCGWQHVSVSLVDKPNTTPRWEVMCFVKDLFWEDEEEVVQFHPKKSEYVNAHNGCLHLWRPLDHKLITPPSIFVGPK